jgi:hypothetical protein
MTSYTTTVPYYTGVGSRETPLPIQAIMQAIARKLAVYNFTLRSGGADGADKAFESGAGINKQIFLAKHATPEAMDIAAKFHPAWNKCSAYARKLHGRNAFQVLGPNLSEPSQFLMCWTPDKCTKHEYRTIKTGGTGTAISIADAYGVPVENLANRDTLDKWSKWLLE